MQFCSFKKIVPQNVELERKQLEEECLKLRSKLNAIRQKRRQIRSFLKYDVSEQLMKWYRMKQYAERKRQLVVEDYQSEVTKKNHRRRWLNLAQKWNVTNDCFYIWHRGPYGTINDLRVASEVSNFPFADQEFLTLKNDKGTIFNGSQSMNNPSSSLVSSLGLTVTSDIAQAFYQNASTGIQPTHENKRVPWIEINSAIGLIVLLLSTLEKKPHSVIKYQNKLVPQGSTSKIGIRKGDIVTFYHLFSDDSFQIFGKRSFNVALNGLLRCLADAGAAVEKIDRTLALPHRIECTNGGIYLVGGLTIAFGTDTVQWAKAMKYVLTNAKWLVAFTTKHHDR